MVKIVYKDAFVGWETLSDAYNDDLTFLKGETASKATYIDEEGGEKIVLKGANLTYNEEFGFITGGSVDQIVFQNGDSAAMVTITGDFKGKQLSNLISSDGGVQSMLDKILAGNDTYLGSSHADNIFAGKGDDKLFGNDGNDILGGGKGHDIMTGGKGSDFFYFVKGDGKDVVTDFDAVGGGSKQDYIAADPEAVDIIKSGHDVIIDFGGGHTLTLLDVHRSDISSADFEFPAI
jgi:Ca2+-binding RTX toxin-like protein